MNPFPTLYKKTTTGAQQEWTVSVEDNVVVTRWGQTGGKIQVTQDAKQGKNVGRSNETSPEEQALADAFSLWEKKKRHRGYTESADGAMKGEVSELVEGGLYPMLAHRYDKHAQKILWPAYAQPKLDGHRCIVTIKNGKATMWSRKRKPIISVPHIIAYFEAKIRGDATFDGELYNHAYRDKFQELTSFIRQQKTPKEGHEVVQYHIYDFPHPANFEDRLGALGEFFGLAVKDDAPIKLVQTVEVKDEDDLLLAFEKFLDQGYEGAIVRNKLGPYTIDKRSYDLQKVKTFLDEEFEVINVKEGKGRLVGHAIFVCWTSDEIEFSAKMAGPIEELKQYWEDPSLAIGKKVTVQFQGWTDEGKPRFPVVLRFREDV